MAEARPDVHNKDDTPRRVAALKPERATVKRRPQQKFTTMAARKTPQSQPVSPNAGKPVGAVSQATKLKRKRAVRGLREALDGGMTPLEVILKRMRDPRSVPTASYQAAVAAAPYVHPKLTAVAYKDLTPKTAPIDLSGLSNQELAIFEKVLKGMIAPPPPAGPVEVMEAIVDAAGEDW